MIVRILGEGQYDVSDEALGALNELDAAVEAAVEAGDEAAFGTRPGARCSTAYARRRCRTRPTRLDASDLILPPADATIDEVRDMLSDDGLIPG